MPEIPLKEETRKVGFTRRPHRILSILMYSCGIRMEENLAHLYEEIKNEEGLINIWGGMADKDRRVPLSVRLREMCYHYCKAFEPKKFVFEGRDKESDRRSWNMIGKFFLNYIKTTKYRDKKASI